MHPRRPWYGIIYYLLGAQGAFFAWILAVFGVFVSFSEALLFAANPSPRATNVAAALADPPLLQRWVEVEGVEVDLDRVANLADGGLEGVPDTVLIGRDDPAAALLEATLDGLRRLRADLQGTLASQRRLPAEVHRTIADTARALRATRAAPSTWPRTSAGRPSAEPAACQRARAALTHIQHLRAGFLRAVERQDVLLKDIDKAILDFETDVAAGRLWPKQALVVFSDAPRMPDASVEPTSPWMSAREAASEADSGSAVAGAAAEGLTSMVTRWRTRVESRLRRLEKAVRPRAIRQGMLTPLPISKIDTSKRRYGIGVGAQYLVVGHRPNEVAFVLGLASVVVLGLLGAGLFALRSEAASVPAAAAPGAAPATPPDSLSEADDEADAARAAEPTGEVVGT